MRNALLALLIAVLTGPLAAAQEAHFLIESFDVTGVRWAPREVIVAESRLREDHSYDEAGLSDAMGRIERLPFVLFAEFRLRKGSAPGRYVLVIQIRETRPLFVSARSQAAWLAGSRALGEKPEVEDHRFDFLTVGGRWFIGARGMIHAAAELQREDRYSAGYTHFDVFGTRATVSVLASYQNRHIGGFPGYFTEWKRRDDVSLQLLASMPVTVNQSVRALWTRSHQPVLRVEPGRLPGTSVFFLDPAPVDQRELAWTFDTTNDSLFPTSGTRVSASVTQVEFANRIDGSIRTQESNQYAIVSERNQPIGPDDALTTGIDLFRRNGFDEVRPHLRYSMSLWDRDKTTRWGDLRLELVADRTFRFSDGDRRSHAGARAGIVMRNVWGLVRLEFQYTGWRDPD